MGLEPTRQRRRARPRAATTARHPTAAAHAARRDGRRTHCRGGRSQKGLGRVCAGHAALARPDPDPAPASDHSPRRPSCFDHQQQIAAKAAEATQSKKRKATQAWHHHYRAHRPGGRDGVRAFAAGFGGALPPLGRCRLHTNGTEPCVRDPPAGGERRARHEAHARRTRTGGREGADKGTDRAAAGAGASDVRPQLSVWVASRCYGVGFPSSSGPTSWFPPQP